MQGNAFTLTLDTLGPQVEIVAPPYTAPGIQTEFWVNADEVLALNHTVYVIDAAGERHDLVLEHQGARLQAQVNFEGYPYGLARIYAQVMDEVHNRSALVMKAMEIRRMAPVRAVLTLTTRPLIIKDDRPKQGPALADKKTRTTPALVDACSRRGPRLADSARKLQVSDKSRRIEVADRGGE